MLILGTSSPSLTKIAKFVSAIITRSAEPDLQSSNHEARREIHHIGDTVNGYSYNVLLPPIKCRAGRVLGNCRGSVVLSCSAIPRLEVKE